ncbi:hypothetical protein C8R43DRAFT_948028 [Mycena crocata]|nr:hypothetical protein C8R43DRAFT_948028 [Mycena crocata]
METTSRQVTAWDKQQFEERVEGYINKLETENDKALKDQTVSDLKKFLDSVHSTGSVWKDIVYRVMEGRVQAETADYQLTVLWQNYKVQSKLRQHQREADVYAQSLEPFVPATSNPIAFSGASNQHSSASPWSSVPSSTHSHGRPPSHNSGIFDLQLGTPSPQAGPSPEQTARGRRIQASHHAAATGPLNRMAYLAANIHNYNVPPASPAVSLNSNAQFHMGIHNYQNAGGTLPTYPNFNSYQGYPHGYRPGPPS